LKVTLHIGAEKTGTTSIQRTLADAREDLAAQGILYPELFGSGNHMEIAVAAMDNDRNDELKMIELGRQNCDHDEYRRRLQAKLQAEIASGDYQTLIISNEHCHSRLLTDTALSRLVDFLASVGPVSSTEVIVYLRRQDRLAVSLQSTVLKLGGAEKMFPHGPNGKLPEYFCFDRLLDRYARVFGRKNLFVRLYEGDSSLTRDVVSDFYALAGLGAPASTVELNTSLSAAQGLFLERFNKTFPRIWDGKINPDRGPIGWVIRNACPGKPYRPARQAALSFFERFAEGNAYVRATYFPDLDRPTLFDDDFSEYPEAEDMPDLTSDQLFEFITAIWRHAQYRPPSS
jgi:hypothetical protein